MILWILQSGPDRSHLVDYKRIDRLCDAKQAAKELPHTPNGEERPYVIRRAKYTPVNRIFDRIEETIVINNAGPAYDKVF